MDVRRAELCVFDSSGEYLAIGGRDGEVRIWETGSGQLKQRFVPGQSGGEIKCLAWSRTTKEVSATFYQLYASSRGGVVSV